MISELIGRVWKYGDDVNTDVIFPGKYTYTASGRNEIASHALEDLDPDFAQQVQSGDIIVAGRNWGCGSSREQAATCLAYNGVSAIIAASFGRIFYRNALNNGLFAIVSPTAVDNIVAGETIRIDLKNNTIVYGAGEVSFSPSSPTMLEIVKSGGLVSYIKQRLSV